jgi:hypothetical protein
MKKKIPNFKSDAAAITQMGELGSNRSGVVPLQNPRIYEFMALSQGKSANCPTGSPNIYVFHGTVPRA